MTDILPDIERWRRVTEEVPEDDEAVLTFSDPSRTPCIAFRRFGEWFAAYAYSMPTPTHWRPLPAAPVQIHTPVPAPQATGEPRTVEDAAADRIVELEAQYEAERSARADVERWYQDQVNVGKVLAEALEPFAALDPYHPRTAGVFTFAEVCAAQAARKAWVNPLNPRRPMGAFAVPRKDWSTECMRVSGHDPGRCLFYPDNSDSAFEVRVCKRCRVVYVPQD